MESDESVYNFQRRLTWTYLAVIGLTSLTQLMLVPVVRHMLGFHEIGISQLILGILALWVFKVDYTKQSSVKQFVSLAFELLLIVSASFFGVYKIYQFLFMCLIAKAALVLRMKPLIAMCVSVYVLHSILSLIKVSGYYAAIFNFPEGTIPPRYPFIMILETQLYFLFALAVVAAMMRTMVSERRNRLRAEQLADDVEQLIIKNERSRISRDIHDALGHTLTSLNIQLDVAKTMFEKDPVVAKEALVTAKDLASGSLADVRRSVHMIREEEVNSFNLSEAISNLITRAKRNHDLQIDMSVDPVDLPLFKAHNLFCIVQEALTNAQRHAHAESVKIKLKQEPDHIDIEIVDDGKGFDFSKETPGLGLRSMQERADGVGGTLRVASTSDGTTVSMRVPL